MLKTIFKFKVDNPRWPLPLRIVTLLLATSLMTAGLQLATHANTPQLLFREDTIKDPGSLAVKLQDSRAAVSKLIATQLSDETQQLLKEYDGVSPPSPALRKALITDLNQLLHAGPLYDTQSFTHIKFREQTQALLTQNPQHGEALVYLNRCLLADAYPQEIAAPLEQKAAENFKGIQTCRENLRHIKRSLENYRTDVDEHPQWLSELSPQYLDKKHLLCPADTTAGVPKILTEGSADPTLPCSYLYEFRPEQKEGQELLLKYEGDMLPIVRCQHHLLNLSVSGKIYRNGPQRALYNNSTVKTLKSVSTQTNPLTDLPPEVRQQMKANRLKNGDQVKSTSSLKISPSQDLQAQLTAKFGTAFLESPEGQKLLEQFTPVSAAASNPKAFENLLDKPMPEIALTDLSEKPVTLETLRGTFVLVNFFSTDATTCGAKLQHIEDLCETYNAAQLRGVGISTGNTVKAIKAFKEKYQLSMPLWIDKNNTIQMLLNRDASKSQTQLITLLLNREGVVKATFIDFDPETFSQRIQQFVRAKE